MNKTRKVGIYLRLSKEDEKLGESSSITNQRLILLDYIKKNNLEYIDEYIDDGVSGTTFDRVGFNRLLTDIEQKKINMVITKDTSRLGRDHIEFGYYVEKFFPENNIRYVAVCDNIDTENNNNDMLLFKSAYNDMYVKDISNKIRASLNIKKRNGEFVGAYAPYGYKKDKYNKHKLVIDTNVSTIVKEIYNLFLNGYTLNKIKDTLTKRNIPTPSIYKNMNKKINSHLFGEWNTKTITDILTNPTYIGNLTQGRNKKINYKSKKRIHVSKENWIIKENSCPQIINKETFNMVQELLKKNKNNTKKSINNNLLLKGLIYCEECGHKIGFRRVSRTTKDGTTTNKYYGNCNYYLKHKNYNVCTPHSISYKEIEALIISNIKEVLSRLNEEKTNKLLTEIKIENNNVDNNRKNELEKELKLIKLKKENLYEDKISEFIDKELYITMKEKLEKEETLKKEELTNIKKNLSIKKDFSLKKYIKLIINNIDNYLISNLIEKITITEKGQINIYYKIKNET